LTKPFVTFAQHKLAGAALLLAATLLAMVLANSPWKDIYKHCLEMEIAVSAGTWAITKSLHHWVNDGLMGIFFFVVGLEIKREIIAGDLSDRRKALLPIVAAVGGMLVPAAFFWSQNPSGVESRGWGIPMATDIAFALGVLAILGNRVPIALKVFLTALAIVDDIGAVLVIAVFYTDEIHFVSLIIGGSFWGASVVANLLGTRSSVVYLLLGTMVWVAFLKSGVHATLAAVLMAATIPAQTRVDGRAFVDRIGGLLARLQHVGMPDGRKLLRVEQLQVLHGIGHIMEGAMPPLQKLEHALVPVVTFLVLPLFALANAGVEIGGGIIAAYQSSICVGIILGLVVGKQIGIFGFAWLAVKLGWADLPSRVTWRQLHAVSVLGGIGFTMSLFVGGLAFHDPAQMQVVKVGVLSGTFLSAIVGILLLWLARPRITADK
jgi:NhaA family Na+:H+ antiporter